MREEKAALSESISVSLKVSVILTARWLLSLLSCKLSSFLGLAVLPPDGPPSQSASPAGLN